jgi:hypothetical protein
MPEGDEMRIAVSMIWLMVGLTATQTALSATNVEKIRNQKVLVTEETLAPGEKATFADALPSILVYLEGNSAEITKAGGGIQRDLITRGETVFEPTDARTIKNSGSSTLSFARIGFLTPGDPEMWGMSGLSPNYKMLIENRFARAYDIKIPAQTFEPQHTHHDRVVVSLSGAELEHILPDGTKQPSTLKTGEIVWRLGATHVGHNMGHTDLWVIAIEPK